jgi:hypothetical protein
VTAETPSQLSKITVLSTTIVFNLDRQVYMKLTLLFVIFALAIASGRSQTLPQGRVKASIATHRTCLVDSEVSVMLVRFRAHIRNDGATTLVLTQPIYPLVRVANTLADFKKRNYLFSLHPPDIIETSDKSQKFRERQSQYVLEPGRSFEVETEEVTIPLSRSPKTSRSDGLFPGTYYVKVIIPMNDAVGKAEALGESEPITLVIDQNHAISTCDGKAGGTY